MDSTYAHKILGKAKYIRKKKKSFHTHTHAEVALMDVFSTMNQKLAFVISRVELIKKLQKKYSTYTAIITAF